MNSEQSKYHIYDQKTTQILGEEVRTQKARFQFHQHCCHLF